MTMNPFEQSRQQLLHYLTSNAEQEVIDYIRQEMQHDAPDSIPTEEELFAFFQSPDEPTELDTYQQMLATFMELPAYRVVIMPYGVHECLRPHLRCGPHRKAARLGTDIK